MLAGFVGEVDQFCDHAGCAIYRSGDAGVFHLAQGSIAGAPDQVDADDARVVAMRFERRAVRSEEIAGAAPGSVVFPMMYRGRVDGFMLINSGAERDSYRPDEIELLAYAVQQIGLDTAALQAEDNRRRAAALEEQAHLPRANAQDARAMFALLLGKAGAGGLLIAPDTVKIDA